MPTATVELAVDVVKTGNGFDDMARKVQGNTRQAAQRWAQAVARDAKTRSPVRTGYLKKSIRASKVRDFVWQVEVGAYYGIYVEYGTRYMRAQPFLRPAVVAATNEFKRNFGAVFK